MTEALADAGVVPAEDAAEVRDRASFTVEAVKEREKVTDHDVAAFVDVVAESVGEAGRLGAPRAHLVGRAGHGAGHAAVPGGHDPRGGRARLPRRARSAARASTQDTLCVGRTHGVHAEPTTFGVKLAGFAFEADRNLHRLERGGRGRLGGRAVGRRGHLRRQRPRARGGRARPARPGARGRLDAGRGARPPRRAAVRHRLRRAPGSSASPPRSATSSAPRCARSRSRSGRARRARRRCRTSATRSSPSGSPGIARLLRGYAQAGLENVALWHERDISHSSVERVALPDATILLDYAQHLAVRVVEGMTVHADRMRKNLDLTHGALFSQRALLALVESGKSRDDAYRIVQENARHAWETGTPFRDLLGDRGARARPRRGLRPRGASCATRPRSLDGWTASRAEALKPAVEAADASLVRRIAAVAACLAVRVRRCAPAIAPGRRRRAKKLSLKQKKQRCLKKAAKKRSRRARRSAVRRCRRRYAARRPAPQAPARRPTPSRRDPPRPRRRRPARRCRATCRSPRASSASRSPARSVGAGEVTIELRNYGEDPHDLVVERSGAEVGRWGEIGPGAVSRKTLALSRAATSSSARSRATSRSA